MAAGQVPTGNLTAFYGNTTAGVPASPILIDAAFQDMVQTINDNWTWLQNFIAQPTIGFPDSSVTTNKIADLAIITQKLADAGVTTVKIADGAITTAKLADLLITAQKIADGAITEPKYATGSVSSRAIANYAVGATKMDPALFANITDIAINARFGQIDAQLADISPDDSFNYNHFISSLSSYLGLINDGSGDNGMRLYLLPNAKVTTGVGGTLKIFGDPYHLQTDSGNYDYRDLGLYFSADQDGDIGVNEQGVFWINGKVLGPTYINKNPDIGFSFQDGLVRAGRFTYTNKSGAGNAVLILGHTTTGYQTTLVDVKLVLDGGIAFNDNSKAYIRWNDAGGVASNKVAYLGSGIEYTIGGKLTTRVTSEKSEFLVNGNNVFEISASAIKANRAIVNNNKLIVNAAVTTVDATLYNRIKFGVASAHTVSNFTGVDGQQIRLLFASNTTTIAHNSNIKLAGGVNFTPVADDTLVLENWDGIWHEVTRSPNHA